MISNQKFSLEKKIDQEEQDRHALEIYQNDFKDTKLKASTLFIKAGVLDPNNAKMTESQKGDVYSLSLPVLQSDVVIKSLPLVVQSKKQKNMDIYLSKLKQRHIHVEKNQKKDIIKDKDEEQVRADDSGVSYEQVQIVLQQIENQTSHHFVEEQSSCIAISCLTPKINDKSLRQIFSVYGDIIKVNIRAYYTKADMKAKIVGFLTYKTKEQAQDALRDSRKLAQTMNFQINQGQDVQQCYTYLTKQSPDNQEMNKVQIQIPNNFFLKKVIDRIAKLVATEGYAAEHYIMEKEIENSTYAFLFLDCSESMYYKWKIFQYLSERPNKNEPFQISVGNNIYYPPSLAEEQNIIRNFEKAHNFVIDKNSKEKNKKGQTVGNQLLSEEDRLKLENILRLLNPYRFSIMEGMVFCMNMAQYAADIVSTITVSLSSGSNDSRLARLYLISDILYNSSLPSQAGAYWSFHLYFGYKLPFIFAMLNESNIKSLKTYRIEGEIFKDKVMRILQIWNDWAIYDTKFMMGLECTFLKSDDNISQCDLTTETGLQLKLYENKLQQREKDVIERSCRTKGIPSHGSKAQMIQRIVKVKEYKIQLVKKTNIQKSPTKTQDKNQKGITVSDIDGNQLTQDDLRMIEEHKVQVISYHDIACLHEIQVPKQVKDSVESQLYHYINQFKSTGIYSSERMDELCNIKRQELVKLKSIPIIIEPIYIQTPQDSSKTKKLRKSVSSSSNSKQRKNKQKQRPKYQKDRKNRSRSSSHKKNSRHAQIQSKKK